MTTPPTASPELPDLDHLEALARAATPGKWKAMPFGRVVGGPPRHYINGSAPAQIASFNVTYHEQAPEDEPERQQANADFAAAANPEQVLALIALARRTQPEGEAPQADVETLLYDHQRAVEGVFEHGETGGFYDDLEASRQAIRDALATPAATLSPLCGAQHAESGKEATMADRVDAENYRAMLRVAERNGYASISCAIKSAPRRPALDGVKNYSIQRAAQLDGGQEGSDHA